MLKLWTILIAVLLTPAVFAQPTNRPLIVLIPGAGSSGSTIARLPKFLGNQYFGLYEEQLTKAGLHTLICPLTEDQDHRNLEDRATECAQQIAAESECAQGGRHVVLVGHSMGGLIARLLAHDDRVSSCISSILTLATPHRGTSLADYAIDHEVDPNDVVGQVITAIGFTTARRTYLPEMRADHTKDPVATFNSQTIADNPQVSYFSISDSFTSSPLPLEVTKQILSTLLRKTGLDQTSFGDRNDGIVPEYSQVHGTYLGHLEINHWELACVDPMRATAGCRKAAALVIPVIEKLAAAAVQASSRLIDGQAVY